MRYLAKALQSEHCKVTKLHLHGNNIGDEGCGHLAEALQRENQVTKLWLVNNNIGVEGRSSHPALLKRAKTSSTSLQDIQGLKLSSCPSISPEPLAKTTRPCSITPQASQRPRSTTHRQAHTGRAFGAENNRERLATNMFKDFGQNRRH